MVPQGGIEPPAYSLPMNYSTPELLRHSISITIEYINTQDPRGLSQLSMIQYFF